MKHYITEPPCAFIEAVVGGYSPIDKWTCKFARIAAKMRASVWWVSVVDAAPGSRGDVWRLDRQHGWTVQWTNAIAGETPWV